MNVLGMCVIISKLTYTYKTFVSPNFKISKKKNVADLAFKYPNHFPFIYTFPS